MGVQGLDGPKNGLYHSRNSSRSLSGNPVICLVQVHEIHLDRMSILSDLHNSCKSLKTYIITDCWHQSITVFAHHIVQKSGVCLLSEGASGQPHANFAAVPNRVAVDVHSVPLDSKET